MTSDLKKTALHGEHLKLNARMVPFAGWHMPVQYEGVIEEHMNVRKNVGLFDVSHMGEVFVTGPNALKAIQNFTSNDASVLSAGQAQYSLLLNAQGGMVDDIIVYCIEKNSNYLICVNAANVEKDFAWMRDSAAGVAKVENKSDEWSQIAIQGPNALKLVKKVLSLDLQDTPYFHFKTHVHVGKTWYIAHTGYTGEDGVEIFLPNVDAAPLWQSLLVQGESLGVKAIGLGARDTLRLEMKYSLYGNEITDETSALEAGLGWVVKFSKGDFIGRAALEPQKGKLKRKLVGFKMIDNGIPRQSYPLISLDNQAIGYVTSGTMSPSLREPIGIGYVLSDWAAEGKEFFVQIRGRNAKATVVKTPFVSPTSPPGKVEK